jgi:signal transduction histidine kinase
MAIRFSFKAWIIFVFSTITIGLVAVMSRLSYYTVKEIYLNQLSDQVLLTTRVVMNGFDARYLRYLNPQENNTLAASYYTRYLTVQKGALQIENVSIFDAQLQTLISTDSINRPGMVEPVLLLHRTEIENLKERHAVTSLPFKGEDQRWYLWGFFRIDDAHWLCVRENADRLARVEELSLIFWGIGLGGVMLTLIGGLFLARTLTRPIDRLVRFSRELGKGEWAAPVPTDIKGELSSLAQAMHTMRENLVARQKEKETILAHIAHEIRNPLGGIELLTGLLQEDLACENKNMEYTRKILDEIGGLKSLINNYLNFGRPSVAHPENVNAAEIVSEVLVLLQHALHEKNIRVTSEGVKKIWFDRNHLKHILTNLLTNSIQAVEQGGHITIAMKQHGTERILEISDDGLGIADASMQTIFEPFFTTHSNGTGLGLAICKKLCSENGSVISVKNNADKGCTFIITTSESHT